MTTMCSERRKEEPKGQLEAQDRIFYGSNERGSNKLLMVEETRNKTAQNLQWALEGQDKRSATRSIVNGWDKRPAPSAGAILRRG